MPRDTKPCPRCLVTRAPGRGGAGPLERDPEAEDPLPVEEEEEADLDPQEPPPPPLVLGGHAASLTPY